MSWWRCSWRVAGGSGDASLQNAGALSTTPGPPGLSGRVLNEAGTPLEGVQVVVHERTTNRRTRQVSDADGAFVLALEPGVYDLGLDLEGALDAATSFYGPIAVTSAVRRDFVLHSVEGRGVDQVFGKIWLRPGVPAANRQVALRAGALLRDAEAQKLASVTTTTSADGSFALGVGSDRDVALDVELFDSAGSLDEWVDVAKREKACYVEFACETSAAENRLRCTEWDDTGLSQAQGVLGQGALIQPFAEARVIGGDTAKLSQGLIPVGAPKTLLSEMVIGGPPDDPEHAELWRVLKHCPIELNTQASWFYDYSVHIKPDRSTDWAFTDQSGQSYQLWVSITLWEHQVSFDSNQPNIERIDYDLSSI